MSKIDRLRQRLARGMFGDDKNPDWTEEGKKKYFALPEKAKRKLRANMFGVEPLTPNAPAIYRSPVGAYPFGTEEAPKATAAPLQKEVPFGKENRSKRQIKQKMRKEQKERHDTVEVFPIHNAKPILKFDKKTRKYLKNKPMPDTSLVGEHGSGVMGSDRGLIRPKKPTQADRARIISAKQLRQRIAQVRLAYAGPPQDVINAFRNKEALKMHAKSKKGKELSFQTDGETLFQSGYPIAQHTETGINFSYQGHPSASTAQAGRMLGINTFHAKGKYYINGNEVDPTQYDYTDVPFKDIQEGTVKVNKNIKTVPMTPEKRQLMKDQDYFSTKARRELKDPDTGEIYDQVVVQPEDQEEINRVTGLDTPLPEETFATEIHHSLPKSKAQALRRSTTGAVALSPRSHQEAHFPERFVKRSLKKARLKIARMRMAAAPGISMNPQHGRTIADAFDTMQHTPNSPKVKASYNAFINETNDQARALQKSGVKFESLRKRQPYGKRGGIQGYEGYKDMHSDIEKNKHLFYRMSDNDYKGFEDNPMFKMTDIRNSGGHRMRANDVFRAVHDINGHNLAGRSAFTPSGEQRAFLQHRKMYSPLASKAMFTETAGQGNWTNYSKKHGAKNQYFQKINKLGNLKFPQQKAGLLPDNIIGGKWHQRLGKQRNIRVKTSIRTMQARVGMKLRHSDNMRNYKKLVATPEGRQWIEDNKAGWYIGKDGTPRNVVNNPMDAQKSLNETPGKGDLYVVANTKDVRDPDSKEISDGFEKWEKTMPDADVSIGGFTDEKGIMEYDSSAAFRSDNPQKAMGFAKEFNQTSYMVISGKNAEVNFFKPDGSLIPKSE